MEARRNRCPAERATARVAKDVAVAAIGGDGDGED